MDPSISDLLITLTFSFMCLLTAKYLKGVGMFLVYVLTSKEGK